MRDSIQCLGWFVRRTADIPRLGTFYRDALALPQTSEHPQGWIFWGGEACYFEIMGGGSPRPRYTSPTQQAIVPVFRVHGIQGTIDRLTASGVTFIEDRTDTSGRAAYFLDPDGLVTGIAERDSGLDADRESARRWAAGETRIPRVGPMPPDIQLLAWIELHVAGVAGEVAFYRDVIGLPVVEDHGAAGASLDLGDTVLLRILPGGLMEDVPADRAAADNMWMLRVHDLPGLEADLRAAGTRYINEAFENGGGILVYVADPEGHIVGLQDHPGDPALPVIDEGTRRWSQRRPATV